MAIQFDIPTWGINGLVPKYRLPKWILFIQAALYSLTWRFGLFTEYQTGSNYALYDHATTYSAGNRVQYGFSVYESLTSGNTGNNPLSDSVNWIAVNQYFIGSDERSRYNGRYLNLTYQLNRYFQKQLNANGYTGFKQPPYPYPYGNASGAGGTFSDIYITNVSPSATSFVMYPDGARSSKMYPKTSTGYMFSTPVYSGATSYTFAIHFPLSVYNSLGATNDIRNSIISQFVNQYIISGTGFQIFTY